VTGGNLDEDDRDAIGILDPHLHQAPGFCDWLPQDVDSRRGQAAVLGADIPYLQPDLHRGSGRPGRMPGHLQQSLAEKEHYCWIFRRAELAVDRQPQYVAVEAPAPVQVDWAQQNTAAEYFHPAMLAAQVPKLHMNRLRWLPFSIVAGDAMVTVPMWGCVFLAVARLVW
jgi:hypothetical protein